MKLPPFSIRAFAVVCVAVTTAYVMWMGYRLNQVLSSSDWCARALQAERISPGNTFVGLTSCVSLLTIQLKSVATNSHILFGVVAMCLLVLIVIVVAGARFSGKLPGGGEVDMAPSDSPLPVQVTNPPSAPIPTVSAPPAPTGPAMSETQP